ncbi:hypothetical protein HKD37_02G005412 [Glycine soja]
MWKVKLPPKVSIFLWRMMRNKLPSRGNFMRRTIIGEDAAYSMKFGKPVMHGWLLKLLSHTLDEYYWQHRIPPENKSLQARWGTAWVLWNNIVFNGGHFDKQKIVQEIMFQSWTRIKEFDKSFSYSFVQWSMNESGTLLVGC